MTTVPYIAIDVSVLSIKKNIDLTDLRTAGTDVSIYEKREIMYYANIKDPDQTTHLYILISILTINNI